MDFPPTEIGFSLFVLLYFEIVCTTNMVQLIIEIDSIRYFAQLTPYDFTPQIKFTIYIVIPKISLLNSTRSCCCTRKCIESKWTSSKELVAVKK